MADNNPPYFPLSTQAAKIKDALHLEDERLWNALRRKVKQACYQMVNKYKGDQHDRELPTWTEFPNHLLQQARESVLVDDADDGGILQRPNGQAALDWLFGTAYNNMKREMARSKPRDHRQGGNSPSLEQQRSPILGHHPDPSGAISDFALPPISIAGPSRVDGNGLPGIPVPHLANGHYNTILNHTYQPPTAAHPGASPGLPPQHSGPTNFPPHQLVGYSGQQNDGPSDTEPVHADSHILETRDETGKIYYYNSRTNASAWDRNDPRLL